MFFGHERREIAEFRKAVEQFKTDLPAVLESLRAMIEREHAANAAFRKAQQKFLAHAQETINPSLVEADVREMLIQHVLTEEIFTKVFPGTPFHKDNNVARELYKLEGTFFTGNTKFKTLKGLEPYYAAIRAAAAQIGSHHEKQTFLKVIYENFYKVYNKKAADRLGVVYTPNEIVRFMIESADWLCEKHFGRNLIDKDVEILDPATGTGTFICELLEHFRGQPKKMQHKYRRELHANEVAILPVLRRQPEHRGDLRRDHGRVRGVPEPVLRGHAGQRRGVAEARRAHRRPVRRCVGRQHQAHPRAELAAHQRGDRESAL